jgi:putative transposase
MKALFPNLSISVLTGLFGKTRLAWYERERSGISMDETNAHVLELVKVVRRLHPRLGSAKLYFLLAPAMREMGIALGRDGLHNLLATNDMLVKRTRRRYVRTTNSRHPYDKYTNVFKELEINAPLQAWVSDITYIRINEGFAYLSLITDAYSRKIVGHQLHPNLSHEGCLWALNKALANHQGATLKGMLHHSDRGLQYCCTAYIDTLQGQGIVISMTEDSDPTDNAVAERINGILKTEYGLDGWFTNIKQANEQTDTAVRLYNTSRPHGSLDYLTPEQAHLKSGLLDKRWHSKRKKAKETKVLEA